jgi:murein DD-endopeptidase MepM/ murein hydrolase activator NlpD
MKFSGMMFGTCLLLIILGNDAYPKPGLPLTPSCCPWPVRGVPPSVMNTVSALQMYGSKPGFHHGLDLQAPAGTKIYAPVSGVVATRYYYKRPSPYTYEVSIATENGYRWEFHHIDPESIPLDIRQLAEQRGVVQQGAVLGDIYDASPLNIPPHVHINVIGAEGYYHDPLKFFPPLADPQPPVINGIYLVDEAASQWEL